MQKTYDINIKNYKNLEPPKEFLDELPISAQISEKVTESRQIINNIISGKDKRLLIITGPCSIHDEKAGIEYAKKLVKLQSKINKNIYLVMRAYFEKPRTTVGWKGLINDPDLNGTFDMSKGLRKARKFLLDILDLGLPAGTEFLDPFTPQYLADLISWGAIGARTTESQSHRELASALSCPVGFKNGTSGSLDIAIDAIFSANSPHHLLSVNKDGGISHFTSLGNETAHIILRGGRDGTNYSKEQVERTCERLKNKGLISKVMIDFSHANSEKKYKNQLKVGADVASQIENGSESIFGVMIESHLNEGNQKVGPLTSLKYGVSITDSCIGWNDTEELLRALAKSVKIRNN